jgi:hypothetical protein
MMKNTLKLSICCFAAWGFLFVAGCAGTTVMVGDPPPAGGGAPREGRLPRVREGGPPPWAPAHGYRSKYAYRYYPAAEVYFDTGRGVYFYYRNGKWRISARLPIRIHARLGDAVFLEMDTDRPYKYHTDVRKRYPPGLAGERGKR